ncbi:hypothetical protein [Chryseobacterium sp. OSA05B]|uniref:hypothetical protein n=1 Tax=Chryseobacterium sp. OSA05B TaxID=2862650 RepID=UPI001CBFF754|nr:hypothetical protein [Chryseobacterium sp. OSA05B]
MRKILPLLLVLLAVIIKAQQYPLVVYNFSPVAVTKLKIKVTDPTTWRYDCHPIASGETSGLIQPGTTVTYDLMNTSATKTPPINQWDIMSHYIGIPDAIYNVSAGATIPTAISSIINWQSITIVFANGETIDLGRGCTEPGTPTYNSGATPSGRIATTNTLVTPAQQVLTIF